MKRRKEEKNCSCEYYLCILYGSVIDKSESTTNGRRSEWVRARHSIVCIIRQNVDELERSEEKNNRVLVSRRAAFTFRMMNKDGGIGLKPGAETVYGTDDTTMVMSEKVK